MEEIKLSRELVREILATKSEIEPKYQMATIAYHQLGNISNDTPDLCSVNAETEEYYVGSWIYGLGFFNVLFPKITTRDLTEEDHEKFDNTYVRISSQPATKLNTR